MRNSITIRKFSEHQSIPADKTHSGFTKSIHVGDIARLRMSRKHYVSGV